jgi:formylglycine-generating enzyme required for sulfatase activity
LADSGEKVASPREKRIDLGDGVVMEFVLVPAGTYVMGMDAVRPSEEFEDLKKQQSRWFWFALVAASGVLLFVGLLIWRTIQRGRVQFSLAGLVGFVLVASATIFIFLYAIAASRRLDAVIPSHACGVQRAALPTHPVHIERPLYMGKYEVTQGQYLQVMGANPSHFNRSDRLPVESVSWDEARQFCTEVSGRTGESVRLPSEAEWEYCCRGGTTSEFSSGDGMGALAKVGWYGKNSGGVTHAVGLKEANPFGLYDMHGNVAEWIEDGFHANYAGAPKNGEVWVASPNVPQREVRGGHWSAYSWSCRSSFRDMWMPSCRFNFLGFRCVLETAAVEDQRPAPPCGGPSVKGESK